MQSLQDKITEQIFDADKSIETHRNLGNKETEYFFIGVAMAFEIAHDWAEALNRPTFDNKMKYLADKYAKKQYDYMHEGNSHRELAACGARCAYQICRDLNAQLDDEADPYKE